MAINLGTSALSNLMLGTTAVYRAFLGTIQVWQREAVATISVSTAQVTLPGPFFTAGDWTNPLVRKRLVIAGGAHVWSYTQGVPALDLGTGRQGDLYVDINAGCYVLGHAGARHSGVGGTAIKVRQNQCWIVSAGGIYGGGGGGGVGGQGGTGVWYSGRTVQEGPAYSEGGGAYYWQTQNGTPVYMVWAGSPLPIPSSAGTSWAYGGYVYYRGNAMRQQDSGESTYYWHAVYRTYTAYDVPNYTSGGAGGTGGRGTGYNSGLVNEAEGGFGGGAPGANAGWGGTGGAGGGWGAQGGTGNTGASGNAGGGAGGAAGGLGGLYIDGYANLNGLSNTGQVLGRTA